MLLSNSKLTLHIQEVGGYGGQEVTGLVSAHVRGAVTLDSPNYAKRLHNELGSECCIVQRSKIEEEWSNSTEMAKLLLNAPEEWADKAFDHQYTLMQQTPFGYWQIPTDEFAVLANNVDAYCRATIRWLERMNEKNLKGAILGSSVGTPADMSLLKNLKPALKVANEGGHIVHRHSYNYPHLTSNDPSWLILRQEREYKELNAAVEFPKLRWAITEIGFDGDGRTLGWKRGASIIDDTLRSYPWYREGMQPAEIAEHELFDWLEAKLQACTWLIFGAFFCACSNGWSNYNVFDSRTDFNLFPRFINRIKAQIPTGTEPAPIPPPDTTPIPPMVNVAYLYKVINCISLNMRRTPVFDPNDLSNVVDKLPVNSTPIIEKIDGVAAKLYGMNLYVHRDYLQLIKSIRV